MHTYNRSLVAAMAYFLGVGIVGLLILAWERRRERRRRGK